MKLMAASMALAGVGLTGCRRWPEEKLVPQSSNPEGRVPGLSDRYATVMDLGGIGHQPVAGAGDAGSAQGVLHPALVAEVPRRLGGHPLDAEPLAHLG